MEYCERVLEPFAKSNFSDNRHGLHAVRTKSGLSPNQTIFLWRRSKGSLYNLKRKNVSRWEANTNDLYTIPDGSKNKCSRTKKQEQCSRFSKRKCVGHGEFSLTHCVLYRFVAES